MASSSAKVTYIGPADARTLTIGNLKSLGVEHDSDLVFKRGETLNVPVAVAKVLKAGAAGNFRVGKLPGEDS